MQASTANRVQAAVNQCTSGTNNPVVDFVARDQGSSIGGRRIHGHLTTKATSKCTTSWNSSSGCSGKQSSTSQYENTSSDHDIFIRHRSHMPATFTTLPLGHCDWWSTKTDRTARWSEHCRAKQTWFALRNTLLPHRGARCSSGWKRGP